MKKGKRRTTEGRNEEKKLEKLKREGRKEKERK